ncbi:hemolysin [Amylolactobacillus amylotrophicus DSM 20534]|uniref:Hemolysin n=3 Tax=Amylolactobacillus TaxID=2767876 RepID=A0A1L6XD62_9LACO|nr:MULTISPECIES: hemolysin family protein [Amylolactobacillus]APT18901.1 hemolysin [Amylolactobacillus amylophilus DSM 20533 = JCM 1125]KRK38844.1 hemolysin [Amylolactobacillus amylotrophicus DSM 20534]KRM42513.1 hemolysin [Amylolactobacillus amylophilus DSM 20533 = JCM 1125]GED80066.1 hypothetical protein LAM01_05390 [Amylolactobacillus amylophilus]
MNGDPGAGSLGGQILLIVILTLINAVFAAAEMAIVSVNRNKLETEANDGDKKAKTLLSVMSQSTNYLATIQVAITFAGFLSSASAATNLAQFLEPLFGGASWAREVSIVVITVALSYVSLVFGELYPKQIAISRSESVAKATVGLVRVVGIFLRPFVWLLSASTNLLMKVTPIDFTDNQDDITREEMLSLIETSRKKGVIGLDEFHMLEGIITFNDKMAREVMVPRTDAFMIDIEDDKQENLDAILDQPYSRIPVYRGDKDKIVGVIHIKTILKIARRDGFGNLKLEDSMASPLFVPETIMIDELLVEMQKTQMQMAVLLDEYGGVVGIATIEDLLEEIVGDIDDESDHSETLYNKINENQYVIAGKMPIDDFNEVFETEIDVSDVDTIAGFAITELGMIPSNSAKLKIPLENGMILTTGRVKGSRLETLTLDVPEDEDGDSNGTEPDSGD